MLARSEIFFGVVGLLSTKTLKKRGCSSSLGILTFVSQLLGWASVRHGQRYSILQKKQARNSVPKCLCKLLQPVDRPMTGSSSLEGHFGTGLRSRFSSAWSNVECGVRSAG